MSQGILDRRALSVRRLSAPADLGSVAAGWNRLAGGLPFRSYDWLEAWWRHYRQPHWDLHVLALEDASGELVGLAPWYSAAGPAQGRVLRFLGSGEVCSDHLTLLAAEGCEAAVAQDVAEWLMQGSTAPWDLIDLSGVDADDTAIGQLAQRLGLKHTVHQRPGQQCWRLKLPHTWDAYLALLSKSRRERVRNLYRKYFVSGRATWHLVEGEADLERGFDILIDLHQRRRQSLGEPGCFASPRFAAFHREVARQMFNCGQLRLHWTELDGQPVAAEYGLTDSDTVYYYQSGLDPTMAEHRPGWLSMMASLKAAIEAGYGTFDFLRGDEAYKASWRGEPQGTLETRIVGRGFTSRCRHGCWLAGRGIKAQVKRCLSHVGLPFRSGQAQGAGQASDG